MALSRTSRKPRPPLAPVAFATRKGVCLNKTMCCLFGPPLAFREAEGLPIRTVGASRAGSGAISEGVGVIA